MIPTINRPTRVTANTATAIDHIIISTIISSIQHRPGITNADISDHFPIVFALSTCEKVNQRIRHTLFIMASTEKIKIGWFKHELSQIE